MDDFSVHNVKPSIWANPESKQLLLEDEIRRSDESRYDHRLHAVLLVLKGLHIDQVAYLLGHSPQSIECWLKRFEMYGFTGLTECKGRYDQESNDDRNSAPISINIDARIEFDSLKYDKR